MDYVRPKRKTSCSVKNLILDDPNAGNSLQDKLCKYQYVQETFANVYTAENIPYSKSNPSRDPAMYQ